MKYRYIINNKSKSVAVLFTGWGMDGSLLADIQLPCDFIVIYDYSNLDLDNILDRYSNIYIFAWSFGVYAASKFIESHKTYPICLSMAINGTETPISDNYGIPQAIFDGTLNNLNERNLTKFQRRICSDATHYSFFNSNKPNRSLENLTNELKQMSNHAANNPCWQQSMWDIAVCSTNDKIFPYDNQLNSWQGKAKEVIIENGSHLPINLRNIISERIIDKSLVKRRFARAYKTYDDNAVFQHTVSKTLLDYWKAIDFREQTDILEIGFGTGYFTKLYSREINPKSLYLNDICDIEELQLSDNLKYNIIQGDGEYILNKLETKYDYIVSTSTIQWFENLSSFFQRAKKHLKPNGFIIISTFGPNNMKEIRSLSKRGLHYHKLETIKQMLINDYDILVLKDDTNVLYFDTPLDIIKHLKLTGVNSITANKTWSKDRFKQFLQKYPTELNKYPLTYNPIYIIAKIKDND